MQLQSWRCWNNCWQWPEKHQ